MEPDTGVLSLSNKRRQGMKLLYQLNVSVSDGVFTNTAQVRQLTILFCQLICSFLTFCSVYAQGSRVTFFQQPFASDLAQAVAAGRYMFMSYQIYCEDELPTGKKLSHLSRGCNYKRAFISHICDSLHQLFSQWSLWCSARGSLTSFHIHVF